MFDGCLVVWVLDSLKKKNSLKDLLRFFKPLVQNAIIGTNYYIGSRTFVHHNKNICKTN